MNSILRKNTSLLVLSLLTIIGVGQSNAQIQTVFENSLRPNASALPFEHRWQSGEQSYRLENEMISADLMSLHQLRKLINRQIQTASRIPNEPQLNSASDEFQSNLSTIQLVGYQSPIDETDNGESSNTTDAGPEFGPEVDAPLASKDNKELRREITEYKQATLADTQLNEALKTSRLQLITSANDAILKINEFRGETTKFKNQIAQISEEVKQPNNLDEAIEPGSPEVDQYTMSESLAQELNQRREELQKKKAELSELESLIQYHSDRVAQIPIDRSQANEKIESIREELNQQVSDSDELDNRLALILLELQRRSAEAELKKLELEEERQEMGAKVDPIKRDFVSRDVKRLEVEVQRWESAINRLRQNEVREEQLKASQKVETAHPSLKTIAKRNESLVNERKSVEEHIQALQAELNKVTDQAESIVERRTEIENKIEAAGLTGTNGMLLVELRRNLNSTGESHIRIRQLQANLRTANLAKVSLDEERDELSDPVGAVKKMINSTNTQDSLTRKALQFVETKREYLDRLIEENQSYGRTISEVSQARKKLIDEINQTMAYIDANALWIRSADPVSLSNLGSTKQGMDEFFDSENWATVAIGTQQRIVQRPYETTFATLSFLVLFGVNRRVKKNMLQAEKNDESST